MIEAWWNYQYMNEVIRNLANAGFRQRDVPAHGEPIVARCRRRKTLDRDSMKEGKKKLEVNYGSKVRWNLRKLDFEGEVKPNAERGNELWSTPIRCRTTRRRTSRR